MHEIRFELTPGNRVFVDRALATGKFANLDEIVNEALFAMERKRVREDSLSRALPEAQRRISE